MKDNIKSAADPAGFSTLQVIAKADKFNEWMYRSFSKWLHGEVLEIGSGIGNISKYIVEGKNSITLSDYNPEYRQQLKSRFGACENVKEVLLIDLQDPRFKDEYKASMEKYDCIILLNVIEHLQDDSTAMQNCIYLLKPGAHLIILAPAYPWLYCNLDKELGHFRRYTLHSMTNLFSNSNLKISEKKYSNFLGILGWTFFGKIMGKKLLGSEMSAFNKLVPLAKLIDKLLFNKVGLSVIVIGEKS